VNAGQEDRVFGLYRDFGTLRSGVDSLKALEFQNDDISVLFPEAAVSRTLPSEEAAGDNVDPAEPIAFIGGLLGWLTYVRPERAGIIAGALAWLGIPTREAALYEKYLRNGGLMVCIRSSSAKRVRNAEVALAATGAERVVRGCTSRTGQVARCETPFGDQFSELAFMC
jgi:hypothetical protein